MSQWAICSLNIRPKQKDRFDRLLKMLKTDKKVTYASELFEIMLSDMESKLPVSGIKGKPTMVLNESAPS
jgi:Trp operon repressor